MLVGCAVQPWDNGKWLSFHTLGIAWSVLGIGLVVAARQRGESSVWLDGFAAALAVMAVARGLARPVAAVATRGAGGSRVHACRHISGIRSKLCAGRHLGLLINLAAVLSWLPSETQTVSGLILANAGGLALAAAVWTAVGTGRDPTARWRDFTDLARGVALVLLAFGLTPTLAGDRADSHWLTWGATLAVVGSMMVALWDRERVSPAAGCTRPASRS